MKKLLRNIVEVPRAAFLIAGFVIVLAIEHVRQAVKKNDDDDWPPGAPA